MSTHFVELFGKEVNYTGEWLNLLAHGQGQAYTKNLDNELITFVGEWDQGELNGYGQMKNLDTGENYDGQWVGSQMHGKGRYEYANGDIYDGDWVNGMAHGNGQYVVVHLGVYNGEFRNNIINGYGKMVYDVGDVYEGEWVNYLRDGFGIYNWSTGEIYAGGYKCSLKDGYGKYVGNTYEYEGPYKENMRHGDGGIYTIVVDGELHTYVGRYEYDKPVGTHFRTVTGIQDKVLAIPDGSTRK